MIAIDHARQEQIEHASAILIKFQERAPDILVEIALMGDKIVL